MAVVGLYLRVADIHVIAPQRRNDLFGHIGWKQPVRRERDYQERGLRFRELLAKIAAGLRGVVVVHGFGDV